MSKYKEFQQKMRNVPTICGYDSKDVAALKYRQILEEVLKEFKLLEDNLEWRKKLGEIE